MLQISRVSLETENKMLKYDTRKEKAMKEAQLAELKHEVSRLTEQLQGRDQQGAPKVRKTSFKWYQLIGVCCCSESIKKKKAGPSYKVEDHH